MLQTWNFGQEAVITQYLLGDLINFTLQHVHVFWRQIPWLIWHIKHWWNSICAYICATLPMVKQVEVQFIMNKYWSIWQWWSITPSKGQRKNTRELILDIVCYCRSLFFLLMDISATTVSAWRCHVEVITQIHFFFGLNMFYQKYNISRQEYNTLDKHL